MSYGILIPNITSLTTTPEDFRAARLISILQVRTWNSSTTVPTFDSNNGFFYAETNTFSLSVQKLVWNNSTKTLAWSTGGVGTISDYNWSRDFDVFFFEGGI